MDNPSQLCQTTNGRGSTLTEVLVALTLFSFVFISCEALMLHSHALVTRYVNETKAFFKVESQSACLEAFGTVCREHSNDG